VRGTLPCVIIIDDQARVNNPRNPTQQGQNETEKKTCYSTRQKDRKGWQHNTEKVSQRFHFDFVVLGFFG